MAIPPRIARARRDSRAKNAKAFINKTVPAVLKSNARARRGVEAAHLVIDPPRYSPPERTVQESSLKEATGRDVGHERPAAVPIRIILRVADTLEAASQLAPRVAILNMASPLRPGGGVLTGATSQEECLCGRTTLYPSLREEFYRLPDVGGVYTPDVLVVRSWGAQGDDLPVSMRFFVDVVTAAMLRMPDVDGDAYVEDKDKEMVTKKMRAVMRMMRRRGVQRIVLGAWGCGAYGNPVREIARAWKRVLCGRKGREIDDGEGWDGLEVVFAIKDRRMAHLFASEFGDGLTIEETVDAIKGEIAQD
ncbi:hypothetical protein NOR_00971 [Metarhizium rileyi]|uniref:Microbial-type PARG catalytic domain-containing protein n=1 Tax=Metarhizium rileyi (strain RCEF 4871) TaxID=1649241 RepID=A0A167JN61_METRR|nr:hypothetical protein NOR_00971 [Metarhizium rileyi RCEF 4871]